VSVKPSEKMWGEFMSFPNSDCVDFKVSTSGSDEFRLRLAGTYSSSLTHSSRVSLTHHLVRTSCTWLARAKLHVPIDALRGHASRGR
jgi:hypothetical protein